MSTAPSTEASAPAAAAPSLLGGAPAPSTPAPEAPATPTSPEAAAPTTTPNYDLQAPEGLKFEGEAYDQFKALAAEKKLSPEDAQKFADLGAKALQSHAAALQEKMKAEMTAFYADIGGEPETWTAQAEADKEFGGDKLTQNMAVANAGLRNLDPSGNLAKILAKTTLGNHPEVIRVFYNYGKTLSPDQLVPGGKAPPKAASIAQQLYPNMNP